MPDANALNNFAPAHDALSADPVEPGAEPFGRDDLSLPKPPVAAPVPSAGAVTGDYFDVCRWEGSE